MMGAIYNPLIMIHAVLCELHFTPFTGFQNSTEFLRTELPQANTAHFQASPSSLALAMKKKKNRIPNDQYHKNSPALAISHKCWLVDLWALWKDTL